MVGSWRINAWISAFGAVLSAVINLGRNPLLVAGWRTLAAAAAFWAVSYVIRVLLMQSVPQQSASVQTEESSAGMHLDLSAEGEEDLGELLREELGRPPAVQPVDKQFQPLQVPKLNSVPSGMEAEELAQAVRHLSREKE